MTFNRFKYISDFKISIHILHTKDDAGRVFFFETLYISIHILHTKDDHFSKK